MVIKGLHLILLNVIGAGMVTGLAATGLHQVFAQLISSGGNKDIDKK